MGKRSVKTDKNIYFKIRDEELHLTRAQAADLMNTVSESRLEKIEYGDIAIQPEDVLEMAVAYNRPNLCNYYCAHECPIGREYVPEIKIASLSEIVLKMLSSLNDLNDEKNRLIQITADGCITNDELPDFLRIQDHLEKISLTVEALKLWVNNTIAEGKIDKNALDVMKKSQKR